MTDLERIEYLRLIQSQNPRNSTKWRNAEKTIRDIAEGAAIRYERMVGYNPIEDDPSMSVDDLLRLCASYEAEIA